ncbi:MAG TPA: hypothetical protein VJA85_01810 [Candidatus Limnocylindria bacterium]|jgi:hypothetical protein|nr:hypothetical protein [Candidatus Limnocylindria bacterium]
MTFLVSRLLTAVTRRLGAWIALATLALVGTAGSTGIGSVVDTLLKLASTGGDWPR